MKHLTGLPSSKTVYCMEICLHGRMWNSALLRISWQSETIAPSVGLLKRSVNLKIWFILFFVVIRCNATQTCIKKPQFFIGASVESVGYGNYFDTSGNTPKFVSAPSGLKHLLVSICKMLRCIFCCCIFIFAMQRWIYFFQFTKYF